MMKKALSIFTILCALSLLSTPAFAYQNHGNQMRQNDRMQRQEIMQPKIKKHKSIKQHKKHNKAVKIKVIKGTPIGAIITSFVS